MFTGIVGSAKIVSVIEQENGWTLVVNAPNIFDKVSIGDSVAIDGACLSVIKKEEKSLSFFVSLESIDKTIIKFYKPETLVNIELPMQPIGYLGGHYVLGHVDATATVANIIKSEEAWFLSIKYPIEFSKYTVYKGSITISGVSLTINKCDDDIVELCIIPITLSKTNLGLLNVGSLVNIEFDILAKYTEKLLIKRDA
jgi:riboflavin synthase